MTVQRTKYGKSYIEVDLPDSVEILYPKALGSKAPALDTSLAEALERAELRLESYLSGTKDLLIVIPDITRRCGLDKFLPFLLSLITKNGISPQNISFLIATGTHKYYSLEQYDSILGYEVINKFPIFEHNCDENNILVGYTSRGTPIEIDRKIMEAEKVLAIGGTLPHYFATFGGGPKLIIPGCASRRCIEYNHAFSLKLDPDWCPGTEMESLDGNILMQDIMEAVAKLESIYFIGNILGDDEMPIRFYAGEVLSTYRKLVKEAEDLFTVSRKSLADIVIVSTGGHPKDIDLLQSHKSMYHAVSALKKGGTLIVFAECANGVGSPTLERLILSGSWEKAVDILKEKYLLNGQAGLSLFKMGGEFKVKIITELEDKWLNLLNFARNKAIDLKADSQNLYPENKLIYYFPVGSISVFKRI